MSSNSPKSTDQLPSVRIATRTDVGLHRFQNEDSLGTLPLSDAYALVVCDGMGGHEGGAEASQIAVEIFLKTLHQSQQGIAEKMQEGVQSANSEIFQAARKRGAAVVMGTTLVAGVIQQEGGSHQLHLANVGDSRAYLFRKGQLQQLTNDHSQVAQLIATGALTKEQAARFPGRNVVTRALGSEAIVTPDLFQFPLYPDDIVLLATDGLHSEIEDERIAEVLRSNSQLDSACDALVVAALAAGGRDNITVILARLEADTKLTAIDSPATVERLPSASYSQRSSTPSTQRSIQPAWVWTFCIALLTALLFVYVWRGMFPMPLRQKTATSAIGERLPDTLQLLPTVDSTIPQPTPGEGLYESN